jgi:UDP-3-O-[3-hydroxymyristoyl] glucosamine N-acyltransferase
MNITALIILSFLANENHKHEFIGNSSVEVNGFCPVSEARPCCVTWIRSMGLFDLSSIADPSKLLIVTDRKPADQSIAGFNLIITDDPRSVYFEILKKFFPPPKNERGIAPSAIIETKSIGSNISIGHNCCIHEDVTIGDNVTIRNNVSIQCPTTIGNDCIIESGVVIGSIGYGYYTDNDNRPIKVPDYGGVRIGNRVDIGANTVIARGTLSDTIIEDDAKIDHLSTIGHNVRIGARSYIIASKLGGSCVIGEDVYIAPGAVIMDNITIGKNAKIGLGAVVARSVEPNKIVVALPARVVKENM